MMPGSKVQKAVHACMVRLLNLGPAKHEKVAIYVDFECLQNCGSCFAAEQFVSISWGPSARVKKLYRVTVGKRKKQICTGNTTRVCSYQKRKGE